MRPLLTLKSNSRDQTTLPIYESAKIIKVLITDIPTGGVAEFINFRVGSDGIVSKLALNTLESWMRIDYVLKFT